jgi:hypothetical protein
MAQMYHENHQLHLLLDKGTRKTQRPVQGCSKRMWTRTTPLEKSLKLTVKIWAFGENDTFSKSCRRHWVAWTGMVRYWLSVIWIAFTGLAPSEPCAASLETKGQPIDNGELKIQHDTSGVTAGPKLGHREKTSYSLFKFLNKSTVIVCLWSLSWINENDWCINEIKSLSSLYISFINM